MNRFGSRGIMSTIWAAAGIVLLASSALGDFGMNKVRYERYDWKVMRTDHFDIHYYAAEEELATEACRTAEQAWQRTSEYLRLSRPPQRKVPIFLYATHQDFIQTNVTDGLIGEGTGGFTEVFKNRMVLPLGPSATQRRIVISHEMVHAQQFYVLYGEGMRSYSLYKSVLVPLWFIEGMAEHVADDWDPQGRMVLRDAVLSGRLPSLALMHGFNHLEPHDAYMCYKAGQSALDMMAIEFGEEKAPAILKNIDEGRSFPMVFEDRTGMSLVEFDRRWQNRLKEDAWSFAKGRKEAVDYGTPFATAPAGYTTINGAPSPSPVNDTIAFYSDRRGNRNLYTGAKRGEARALFSNAKFTSIAGNPAGWSPDGASMAIVTRNGERNRLTVIRAANGKVIRHHDLPFLDVGHPRWAPDGKSIAFSAFDGASSDIYLLDAASGKWRRLTWGGGAASSPAFTPDGKRLVYTSDQEEDGSLAAIEDLGAERPMAVDPVPGRKLKGSRPDVSPDGLWILYDSGEEGAPNLYAASMDGAMVLKLTDARTGIYAGRWMRDGKKIAACTMEGGSQNIYILTDPLSPAALRTSAASATAAALSEPGLPGSGRGEGKGARIGQPGKLPDSQLSPPAGSYMPSFTSVSAPPVHGSAMAMLLDAGCGRAFATEARVAGGLSSAFGGEAGGIEPHPSGAAFAPARPASSATSFRGAKPGQTVLPSPGPAATAPPLRDPLALSVMVTQSGEELRLTWSWTFAGAAVSRYEVYRSTGTLRGGRMIAAVYDPASTSYADNSWQYEEPYNYTVKALSGGGATVGEGTARFQALVAIHKTPYRLSLDTRLVDLFVLVGSITMGAGTSFAGYGAVQMSDLPGDNRMSIGAQAVPGWASMYGISYEYAGYRPTLFLSLRAMQWNQVALAQSYLSTESYEYPPLIRDIYAATVGLSYPLDLYDRVEFGVTAEQFTEVFPLDSEGLTERHATYRIFPAELALVRETTRWHRLMPVEGYRLRVGASQTVPAGSSSLLLTEYNGEAQWYYGFLQDFALATRLWGAASQGHDHRFFFLGGRYSLRAFPSGAVMGNAAVLWNNELRMNLVTHMNLRMPFLPILLTDLQAVGFIDAAAGVDTSAGVHAEDYRPASVGGGLNIIGFMVQTQPILFSIEVARRIDEYQRRPTVYGRLGPVF